jgi:hypothetical protein
VPKKYSKNELFDAATAPAVKKIEKAIRLVAAHASAPQHWSEH